jgi:hypothetical protein
MVGSKFACRRHNKSTGRCPHRTVRRMKKVLCVVVLSAANMASAFAESRTKAPTQGIAVAFFDEERLQNTNGKAALAQFKYFFDMIREIVKRDFPNIELRVLGRGELLRLPDGTGLNVQNIRPELGFVLSARGKKRRVLSGVQTDADFACAASAFFRRSSSACPR